MSSPHVPAWKRIGLKLKFAKDVADDSPHQTASSNIVQHDGDKIDHSADHVNGDAPPTKRRKTNPEKRPSKLESETKSTNGAISTTEGLGITMSGTDAVQAEVTPPQVNGRVTSQSATEPSPKSRRKSVTFTPETKQEDGFTASQLGRQWNQQNLIGSEDARESDATQTSPTRQRSQQQPASPDINQEIVETQSKTEDNKKAKQKKKKSKATSAASDSHETPAYVEYLHHFHTDKASWKFNKAKQNDLLKNALSIDRVPANHTEALVSYLSGLQGEAAARRLFDNATEVLKEIASELEPDVDYEGMDTNQARREAYRAALLRHLEKRKASGIDENEYEDQTIEEIEDLRRKEERGKRADAILTELLNKGINYDEAPSTSNASQAASSSQRTAERAAQKPKTKSRKSRTQVEESSSSSSSSSDSSSDSEDESSPTASANPKAGRKSSGSNSVSSSTQRTSTTSGSTFSSSNSGQIYRPKRNDIPAAPAYGPSVSGAIPTGFGMGGDASNNKRKKFFDDDLLAAAFPKSR